MAHENLSDAVLRERQTLLDATRNFRLQLMNLEREHLQAYSDAVMRSRLAYIRFLDNFVRILTYQRLPNSNSLLRVANRLLQDELLNVDQADDVQIRRQSVYVSLADILSHFNNEGGTSDNYLSSQQDQSE
jgi:recombinational DNA repair ATPase RecF